MRNTCEVAEWVFFGMCPESLKEMVTEVHPMVPFHEYPNQLARLNFDIGIAPLADNSFNRCKSHLKALEYGMLGVPVVAADLEPYRDCPVTHALSDQAEDWTEKLMMLVNDRELRAIEGQRLRQWVMENHLLQHRRQDWGIAMGLDRNAC